MIGGPNMRAETTDSTQPASEGGEDSTLIQADEPVSPSSITPKSTREGTDPYKHQDRE